MNYTLLGFLLLAGSHIIQVIRWFYKKRRNRDISENFIRDIASNHLPHLYHGQTLICKHLGIEIGDPPPIKFIELNGGSHGTD